MDKRTLLANCSALLLLAVQHVHAQTIYKCTDERGAIAYQSAPCADAQREQRIEITPAPVVASAPEYRLAQSKPAPRSTRRQSAPRVEAGAKARSYECRVANGDVFYRHTPCPKSLHAERNKDKTPRNSGKPETDPLRVTGRSIPRAQACKQMHSPTARAHPGRSEDDNGDPYDKLVGRDPCHGF
jgi:Domain of unknown function (DUF4124)